MLLLTLPCKLDKAFPSHCLSHIYTRGSDVGVAPCCQPVLVCRIQRTRQAQTSRCNVTQHRIIKQRCPQQNIIDPWFLCFADLTLTQSVSTDCSNCTRPTQEERNRYILQEEEKTATNVESVFLIALPLLLTTALPAFGLAVLRGRGQRRRGNSRARLLIWRRLLPSALRHRLRCLGHRLPRGHRAEREEKRRQRLGRDGCKGGGRRSCRTALTLRLGPCCRQRRDRTRTRVAARAARGAGGRMRPIWQGVHHIVRALSSDLRGQRCWPRFGDVVDYDVAHRRERATTLDSSVNVIYLI